MVPRSFHDRGLRRGSREARHWFPAASQRVAGGDRQGSYQRGASSRTESLEGARPAALLGGLGSPVTVQDPRRRPVRLSPAHRHADARRYRAPERWVVRLIKKSDNSGSSFAITGDRH
jgi:hypothetical protein